jgi:hypothetical protein
MGGRCMHRAKYFVTEDARESRHPDAHIRGVMKLETLSMQ